MARATIFFILCFIGTGLTSTSSLAQSDRFQKLGVSLDPWSEAQISFWKNTYTRYNSSDYIVHDSTNLAHVYAVETSSARANLKKRELKEELLRIFRKNRNRAEIDPLTLNASQKILFEALGSNQDPRAYEFAADPARIRVQVGQKDRLANAYLISKYYLKRMEEMLEEEGVPKLLARLPFVESSFNQNAHSSVGAVGIWQFMPKTALSDLRVDAAIDERYDPLKSTRAAARFLKSNERYLKSWSLAIMAYNQGPGLVAKAVQKLQTHDPLQIIRLFKNPQFQFASRNYLFEFLAMCDVDAEHELFFKDKESLQLPAFITVSFPFATPMQEILNHYRLKEDPQKILNPHFRTPIWTNRAKLPAHYPVRLTGITLEEFRKLEYPKHQ